MKNMEKEQKKIEVIHKIENLREKREHSKVEMVENTWKVSKNPLFKQLEQKFKQEHEIPELEKRKWDLALRWNMYA